MFVRRVSPSAVKRLPKIATLWEFRDEDARKLLGGLSKWRDTCHAEGETTPR